MKKRNKQKVSKLVDNQKLTVLKQAFCIIIVLVSLIYFIPTPVQADICQNFSGNERADNQSDFTTEQDQYTWKLWSALRSYGLTEEQAIAALANFVGEGQCRPTAVEGDDYDGTMPAKIKSQFGVEKGPELCQYFMEHRNEYTDWVMINCYKFTQEECDSAKKGVKVNQGSRLTNINAVYFNGLGCLGIGFMQATGDACQMLLEWAEKNQCAWYEMDNQLIWFFTPVAQGGCFLNDRLIRFKNETADSSLEECVKWFVLNYEIPSVAIQDREIARRTVYATQLKEKLHGKKWDQEYGDRIVSGAGLIPVHIRKGIFDVGIWADNIRPTIKYPENSGWLTTNQTDKQIARNTDVYHGYVNLIMGNTDESKTYSLFELYGEDLHWYRYMGEDTVTPTLGDHLYSAWSQDKLSVLKKEVFNFSLFSYSSGNYLSCQVYPNRPQVLSTTDISNGYKDPRVKEVQISLFDGYPYVVGSLKLEVAKHINSFMSMLLGHEVLDEIASLFTDIETSDNWKPFIPVVWLVLGFAMIAFIMSLVKKGILYSRGMGNTSPRDIIARFAVGFICIGLMLASAYNPAVFNKSIVNAITIVDRFFDAAIAKAIENDEVIAVEDDDLAVRAAIWKTCIFQPWCRGQFGGLEYEELYSYFDTDPDHKRMPQSNQSIQDITDENGVISTNPYYNSVQNTGDIIVPVGGGKIIRNWAALLYSCGTPYHIDVAMTTKDDIKNPNAEPIWPIMSTTAYNGSLAADLFRVVDAQMDISPQYFGDGSETTNYAGAHMLKPDFSAEGSTMLINCALLLFMVPAIFQKIKSFILLLITTIQMIYYTIIELFKEDSGLKEFGTNFKKNALGYFIADIKIYIMVILYMTFVDKGFVMALIYVLLCITVLGLSFHDVSKWYKDTKQNAKRIIRRAKGERAF